MDFAHFIEWTFYGVVGASAVYGVNILAGLKASVNELNTKIAVIIAKMAHHEKRLDRHESQIELIKEKI